MIRDEKEEHSLNTLIIPPNTPTQWYRTSSFRASSVVAVPVPVVKQHRVLTADEFVHARTMVDHKLSAPRATLPLDKSGKADSSTVSLCGGGHSPPGVYIYPGADPAMTLSQSQSLLKCTRPPTRPPTSPSPTVQETQFSQERVLTSDKFNIRCTTAGLGQRIPDLD